MARIGPREAADYARDFLIAAADVETHEAGIANALIGIGWALYAQVEVELKLVEVELKHEPPAWMIVEEQPRKE